jgi:hypothetical protein
MVSLRGADEQQQQYGSTRVRFKSGASNHHGTDCRQGWQHRFVSRVVKLPISVHAHTRPRGVDAVEHNPTDLRPGQRKEHSTKVPAPLAAPCHSASKSIPRILQLFPLKEVLRERLFPFLALFAFFLSLPFSPLRLSFPSFPFPNNQFHTKSLSRGPSPAFFRSIPIQQKQKAFLLNEMQPGGALALASLRTFFAVRS